MWYQVNNAQEIDSPALLIGEEAVKSNIAAIKSFSDTSLLRPHVKTHKMVEVARLMLAAGIRKFKCATIAEAEMLALAGAEDILLAFQPNQVKAGRFRALSDAYKHIRFSCLVDNFASAKTFNDIFRGSTVEFFIDLNVGMNRTGIAAGQVIDLYKSCAGLNHLGIAGIHAYDGHIHDGDETVRRSRAEAVHRVASDLTNQLSTLSGKSMTLVIGGSPTFMFYLNKPGVEVSPGTFVFWDRQYHELMPDLNFQFAAVLLTRVVSIINDKILCLDLGYKSVASENVLSRRVHFLNAGNAIPISQSEEHLTVEVPDTSIYQVGDIWYGVPYHICPTVALYDSVRVVRSGKAADKWNVIARDRMINY